MLVPGRLGRLTTTVQPDAIVVKTGNVRAFSIPIGSLPREARYLAIQVDGQTVELDEASWNQPGFVLALSRADGPWTVSRCYYLMLLKD